MSVICKSDLVRCLLIKTRCLLDKKVRYHSFPLQPIFQDQLSFQSPEMVNSIRRMKPFTTVMNSTPLNTTKISSSLALTLLPFRTEVMLK